MAVRLLRILNLCAYLIIGNRLPGGLRTLQHTPNGPAIPSEEMTVERCIDGCFGSGYIFAGLEDGQWVIFLFLLNPGSLFAPLPF